MKLLIKQHVFSWSDTYDVYDENGNPKYFVKNEIFALLHRIHVSDMQGNEIGIIKQNFTLFIPHFEVEIGGRPRLRSSSLFSNQSMISITMDGAAKVILWRGIMMCIRVAVRLYTYPRSFSAGAIPM